VSEKTLFRHSTGVRKKLFGEDQNSLHNESRNRIGNRRVVEDCGSNTGFGLMLNGKSDATETVSSLIVHGEASEIPDTLNYFYGLSTVNRLGVRTKNYEYTIKSIAN
jgi:hypothetical protein